MAQPFPAPKTILQQLNTAVTYFIWKGSIFRVPLSVLRAGKTDGGSDLVDVEAKCRALFLHRMLVQGTRKVSVTAAWLRHWNRVCPVQNPPNVICYPPTMNYIKEYARDMAYIAIPREDEPAKQVRKRLYTTLGMMNKPLIGRGVRVVEASSHLPWPRIWRNLHAAWIPADTRSEWYAVIHEHLPTNDRLNRIALHATDRCSTCDQPDSTAHRIMECGEGTVMWHWTRMRLATILRTSTAQIPDEWPLHPTCDIWPPKKRRAVLWILANFVFFRSSYRTHPTMMDNADFMRRARWEIQQAAERQRYLRDYLGVL